MTIAVSAVQGSFAEHEAVLKKLGADFFELRQKKDLERPFDGLILPGGESTVQGKLLRELGMFDVMKEKIQGGLPVLGTCAGLILLAGHLSNDEKTHFGTLPVTVRRNAYGRQLGSFYAEAPFVGAGVVPMTFIRAPYIESVSADAQILAEVNGNIVAARYENQLGMSFHPELCGDVSVYKLFFDIVRAFAA
ncbi:MAG: pyridoxal 5'-phosphate synthase glutaminase subunit PdxT [Oscillospiraceae bacterium]